MSRQAVYKWIVKDSFPDPIDGLDSPRMWSWPEVVAWNVKVRGWRPAHMYGGFDEIV